VTVTYWTPRDLVITFPGGDLMAERATVGVPVQISAGAAAVLAACADKATADQVQAALSAAGYDVTGPDAEAALETLADVGLLCRSAPGGAFPDAEPAASIAADTTWGGRWGPPAWYFHYATRIVSPADAADLAALNADNLAVPLLKRYPRAPQVRLPDPAPLPTVAFQQILTGRRTVREFADKPVTTQQLSQLLWYAHAPQQLLDVPPFGLLPRRAWANGGARSELELYVSVTGACGLAGDGLAPGLYHYQPAGHSLERLGPALSGDRMLGLSCRQPMCASAPVAVFVTAVPGRCSIKYRGPRALRVIYSDAGCLAQVFEMTASALGLGAYITAAFQDADAEQAIGVDGVTETMVLILGAGVPASAAEPERIWHVAPATKMPDHLFDDTEAPDLVAGT